MAFNNPVLVVAVLLVLGFATVGALQTGAIVPPETSHEAVGWKGTVQLRGGIDGTGARFASAGEPGNMSQRVFVTGKLQVSNFAVALGLGDQYEYRVYQIGEGGGKTELGHLKKTYTHTRGAIGVLAPGQVVQLQPYDFVFSGPGTGVFGVELWAEIRSIAHPIHGEWRGMAVDGFELVSGAGTVRRAASDSNLYEEGQTVRLDVRTGWGAWTLQVFDASGSATCGSNPGGFKAFAGSTAIGSGCKHRLTWGGGSTSTTNGEKFVTAEFVIPQGAFKAGASNSWRVVLRNSLTDHASETIFVIDKKLLAPEPPVVTVSDARPEVGETVTLTMTSRVNPSTQLPISRFDVYVWYGTQNVMPGGTSQNWIANGHSVTAKAASSGTYTGTYSFRLADAKVIQYRAIAYDTAGRPSGSFLNATDHGQLVGILPDANGDSEGDIHPPGSDASPVGPLDPTKRGALGLAALLVGVVALLAGAAYYFLPVAAPGRIAAAAIVAVAGLVWIFGSVV